MRYKPEVLKKVQGTILEVYEEFRKICEANGLTYFLMFGTAIGAVRHGGFIPWDDDFDIGMFRDDYDRFVEICMQQDKDSLFELKAVFTDGESASTVTKFQKKGTKFVAYHSRFLKADLGIAIDIFPLDIVPEDKKLRRSQMKKAFIYEKLLFLSRNPFPLIPYKGIKGLAAEYICIFTWLMLNIFHVSPRWLYKKYDETAQKYRNTSSRYITCMMAPPPGQDYYWELEGMLPVREVPFEDTYGPLPGNNHDILELTYGDYMKLPPKSKRVNHAPVKLKF